MLHDNKNHENLTNKRSWVAEFITVFISISLSILLAEVALRYYYLIPEPLAMAQPLGYGAADTEFSIRQKEFDISYRYNKHGFRDKEILIKPVSGTKRLLFLGDSMVEGFGVSERDRFSNILVDRLNSQKKWVDGINIAQLATNPPSYLDNFVRFGAALKPDVAIVGIFLGNDFDGGGAQARVIGVPAVINEIEIYKYTNCKSNEGWFKGSYVYALIRQQFCEKNILYPRLRGGNIWEKFYNRPIDGKLLASFVGVGEVEISKWLQELPQSAVNDALNGQVNPGYLAKFLKSRIKNQELGVHYSQEDIDVTFGYIAGLNEAAKAKNIKVVVVIIPNVFEIYPDVMRKIFKDYWGANSLPPNDEYTVLHRRLCEFLETSHIDYYDPTSHLIQAESPTYFLYDQHLNPTGHRVIANGLVELFHRRGYLLD